MPKIRTRTPRPTVQDISPFLSPQALEIHENLICGRLAAQLNLLLDGYPSFHGLQERVIRDRISALPRTIREEVYFAAGGILCHRYFFRYLADNGGEGVPVGRGAEALRRSFGSCDSFFYIFREEAQRMHSGGFLWLCLDRGARSCFLRLIPTPGYELPPAALTPVFALDLWEHAYLASYGTDRRAYADAFLRQLNWGMVGEGVR